MSIKSVFLPRTATNSHIIFHISHRDWVSLLKRSNLHQKISQPISLKCWNRAFIASIKWMAWTILWSFCCKASDNSFAILNKHSSSVHHKQKLVILQVNFLIGHQIMTIFHFEIQTSIWINIIAQLQFRFSKGSFNRFQPIFDDVMSKILYQQER